MIVPFQSVTIPIDLSETATHCIDFALEFFPPEATFYFCSVVDDAGSCYGAPIGGAVERAPLMEALETAAHRACADAVSRATKQGSFALGNVSYGTTSTSIDRRVRANKSEAVVICTYARIGLAAGIAGTFAESLFESSEVPIIVTHAFDDLSVRGPIAVALDGSDTATAALRTAIEFARANGQGLSIFSVAESSADAAEAARVLNEATEIVRDADVDFELVALEGNVPEAIVENARMRRSPMIVIGTNGRSASSRIFLGSVATAVIERARVPVTVVPKA